MILTNHMRAKIANAAIADAFGKRETALATAEDLVAVKTFEHLIPAKNRAAMAVLPEDYFPMRSVVKVNVGGRSIELKAAKDVRFPYKYEWSRIAVFLPDHEIAIEIDQHLRAKEKLAEEKKTALAAVEALLRSVTTVEKLRTVWPDGEPFYRDVTPAPKPSLPALVVDDVNKMLGLPKAA